MAISSVANGGRSTGIQRNTPAKKNKFSIKAKGLALPLRALTRLDQNEKPRRRCEHPVLGNDSLRPSYLPLCPL
jgi:hypothetical protein